MALVTISRDTYVASVWYRLTKGKPQPESELWRSAVDSTLSTALSRLGDRVAKEPRLYALLQNSSFNVTLGTSGTAGQERIDGLTPTLLLSKEATDHWRVTLTIDGVPQRFALKKQKTRHDLNNPPITSDFINYAIADQSIIVRDATGSIPAGAVLVVTVSGNFTPPIGSQVSEEIFDNLVDIGVEILLEI